MLIETRQKQKEDHNQIGKKEIMDLLPNPGHSQKTADHREEIHFWLFFLQGKQTFPPSEHTPLGLHEVPTDLMESLLLFCGPVQMTI